MAGSTEAFQAPPLHLNGGSACLATGVGPAGEPRLEKQESGLQQSPSVLSPSDNEMPIADAGDAVPEVDAGPLQTAAACSSPGTPQGLSPEGERLFIVSMCVALVCAPAPRAETCDTD